MKKGIVITLFVIFFVCAVYVQWRSTHTTRIWWESTVTEASGHGKWLPRETAESWMKLAVESVREHNIPVAHHLEHRR